MLFFFGVRNSAVATAPLAGIACVHCHTPEAVYGTVVSRYLHLFWIPVFPIGKSSITVCQHCKQALTEREMPANYRAAVQALQQQARTPLTHFALLLLAGAVIVFGMVMSLFAGPKATDAGPQGTDPAAAPATAEAIVGTRYKVSLADGHESYLLAKVNRVTADSVYYRMTDALRAPISDAGAALALRDSVAPANANQRVSAQQWHFMTTGQGMFKRFD